MRTWVYGMTSVDVGRGSAARVDRFNTNIGNSQSPQTTPFEGWHSCISVLYVSGWTDV